uniref:Uncharacterized protein n=1 Tax=Rhizophora mucronata TaxID=61149 RepID=A0A2P2MA41_RHIMU
MRFMFRVWFHIDELAIWGENQQGKGKNSCTCRVYLCNE